MKPCYLINRIAVPQHQHKETVSIQNKMRSNYRYFVDVIGNPEEAYN